jgi:uncharacterized protein
MQINVSQLLREPVGSSREYRLDEAVDIGEARGCPVHGKVSLLRTPDGVLTRFKVTTEVELGCSRCLSRYGHRLDLKFEEEFVPTVDAVSGAPLPPPDEGAFSIDEHHILDTSDAIRQYALMAIPMKPLCRDDCAGLCPSCGQNLNEGACGCPKGQVDPRWSALTKLL